MNQFSLSQKILQEPDRATRDWLPTLSIPRAIPKILIDQMIFNKGAFHPTHKWMGFHASKG